MSEEGSEPATPKPEPEPEPESEPESDAEIPEPQTPPPGGDSERFEDVLHSCVHTVRAGQSRPLCHSMLTAVVQEDLAAYRATRPGPNADMERRIATAMAKISSEEHYRSVGLYVALLIQGIDLARDSHGAIAKGASGEVCHRVGAVVRQSLEARDARRDAEVPPWAIGTIAVLGFVVLVLVALMVTAAVLVLN